MAICKLKHAKKTEERVQRPKTRKKGRHWDQKKREMIAKMKIDMVPDLQGFGI